MLKSKKALLAAAVSFVMATGNCFSVLGESFKDVPSTHWAYNAIDSISSMGILVGDMSGNFSPDSLIDKFATAKVLAAAVGYDYTGASPEEKQNYDAIYNEYKLVIEQYAAAFSKWNSTADREISFLLSKKIFVNSDLNQFVIKGSDGVEKLRALSREEAAEFMVRIMDKTEEAYSFKAESLFKDDAKINETRKNSVYYLKSIGILSGGSDGNYNPKSGVTRAELCVLLNNVFKSMGKIPENYESLQKETEANKQQDSLTNTLVNNIESLSGSIDKYFDSMNVLQINVGDQMKLYKLDPSAKITVNNVESSAEALKNNMQFKALINNSYIIQLDAYESANDSANDSVSEESQNVPSEKTDNHQEFDSLAYKGVISQINITENGSSISITNDDGSEKSFKLNENTVPVYELKIGDLVKLNSIGGKVQSMTILDGSSYSFVTGVISEIGSDYIVLDNNSVQLDSLKLYFDINSINCINSLSDEAITLSSLSEGMKIYAVLDNSSASIIKTIILLSKR